MSNERVERGERMRRVVGIGGVFFKSKDPERLRAWYRDHLGLHLEPWGGSILKWADPDGPGEGGVTVWSVAGEDDEQFGSGGARWRINYIVHDLDAVLEALRQERCDVDPRTEESPLGKFGWVTDPEGNRVELWEPPA